MRSRSKMTQAFSFLLAFGLCHWAVAEEVSFRKQIAPILLKNCLACHGAKKAEGGYRIDTYQKLVGEGDSGAAGFVAQDLDSSEAFRRITSDDESERMPLESDPLSADQIALLKTWIEQGAKYDSKDPQAALASIVPPPDHPSPPESYPRPVPITALTFSPDGKEIFVGGYHELTVWSTDQGKLIRRIEKEGQRTYAIALSPDNKLLAAGSGTPGQLGEVRLFNPESGELVKVLGSTADVVLDLAFNAQGNRLAVAAADSSLRIYDLDDGKSLQEDRAKAEADKKTADEKVAPAKKALDQANQALTGAKKVVTEKESLIKTLNEALAKMKAAAEKSKENKSLAQAMAKTTEAVALLNTDLAEAKKPVEMHTATVAKASQTHTTARQAQAQAESAVAMLAKRTDVLVIASHSDWVNALAWNADGTRLASGSRDKTSKVFDAKTGELLITYSGHGKSVHGVFFHPDNEQVYSSGSDNKIHLWKIADGKKSADVGSFGGEVYKLTSGGEFFFATSADKKVRQYEAKSKKQVREYTGHQDWVLVSTYLDGAKRLATGSFDGQVRIWNTTDGKPMVTFTAAPGLAKTKE